MAFNSNYHDTGLFGVYAVADKDAHIDDLAWAIMQVCCCTRRAPATLPYQRRYLDECGHR